MNLTGQICHQHEVGDVFICKDTDGIHLVVVTAKDDRCIAMAWLNPIRGASTQDRTQKWAWPEVYQLKTDLEHILYNIKED